MEIGSELKSYLYHSFARKHASEDAEINRQRSLNVLASIFDNGLLLTPERIEFKERMQDGALRDRWIVQKRLCLTLLDPPQLPAHAAVFGPISLEWNVQTLQDEGAIPTFYIPIFGEREYGTVGASLISRLYEVQRSLEKLSKMAELAANSPTGAVAVKNQDGSIWQTQLSYGAIRDLVTILQDGAVEIDIQWAAIRSFAGYFYPVDNPRYNETLAYYRQREWRITEMWMRQGETITKPCTLAQKAELLDMDHAYFSRKIEMLSVAGPIVDHCEYLPTVGGKLIQDSVQRIIVADDLTDQVRALLMAKAVAIPVVPMSKLTPT